MKNRTVIHSTPALSAFLALAYASFAFFAALVVGPDGLFPGVFAQHPIWVGLGLLILAAHVTITAMSLSFHRQHTHQGVKLHPIVDAPMQIWLWATTSMSKLDWVSVHIYHHAHSDQKEDVHSPRHSGFWKVFFLGAYMYTQAKSHPDVLKIRKKLPQNRLEKFLAENLFIGPILWVILMSLAFGLKVGAILSVSTFIISPLFAVGGVNALAHYWGYRNYTTSDDSKNVGFLFPLNWVICGELDHNNHHAHPRSCRFSHRWYEFDIGYLYIRMLSAVGLAKILHERSKVNLEASKSSAVVATDLVRPRVSA